MTSASHRPAVVLCGPPGAGKTTVGTLIARALGVEFIDTDREVERVAAAELHVELVAAAFLAGHLEHLLRDVHPDDPPGGADGSA